MAAKLDRAFVEAVLEDHRSVELSARLRATLDFLEKLVLDPESLGPADAQAMRDAGVDERAMDQALQVAFVFGIMDRLADAFDFELSTKRTSRWLGRILLRGGYSSASIPG
ncbi:carboxymuconolactone decarboxylase family protein [Paraliomyxa miuraensis]|uniref:hypothetical protein n=1 Tax=Paraliomyxa miuraensis TaxID=376150 RepID=UPI0022534BE2|nr:hypothetical protein [Paraliomyxa miuraensis]MCX4241324.1 hypothetical protein [Paraliomyxa miuraensis]